MSESIIFSVTWFALPSFAIIDTANFASKRWLTGHWRKRPQLYMNIITNSKQLSVSILQVHGNWATNSNFASANNTERNNSERNKQQRIAYQPSMSNKMNDLSFPSNYSNLRVAENWIWAGAIQIGEKLQSYFVALHFVLISSKSWAIISTAAVSRSIAILICCQFAAQRASV